MRAGSAHFATTRWSLFDQKRSALDKRAPEAALAELCQIYWRPIFVFILRQGYSHADAQDLTQEFFVHVFDDRLVRSADPNRGRFRCFLLTALKNFLCDRRLKSIRRKRGGGIQFESFDDVVKGSDYRDLAAQSLSIYPDEAVFDINWAATVARQALRRLREDCEKRGHRSTFECLRDYLTAERSETSYRYLAAELGLSESSIKRLIYDFRRHYRAFLKEEVAKTVGSSIEVDVEIRYLCTVLAATPMSLANGISELP